MTSIPATVLLPMTPLMAAQIRARAINTIGGFNASSSDISVHSNTPYTQGIKATSSCISSKSMANL
jgi:hypothetical protein